MLILHAILADNQTRPQQAKAVLMRRKLMITIVIALLMVPLGAVPALGWANGADLDGDRKSVV